MKTLDSGTYTCKVSNVAGTVECSADLFVKGLPSSLDACDFSPTQVLFLFRLFLNNSLPSTEPATFVEKLEPSQLLKKGEATQLACRVTGTPPIKITWFANDRELRESSKHKMSFVESTAVLGLTDVAIEDSGEYMCKAQNEAGSDHCTSVVIVKGLSSRDLRMTQPLTRSPDPCPLTRAILFYCRTSLFYQGV